MWAEPAYQPNADADVDAALERLQERFPSVTAERVAQSLRKCGGHAGNAAKELRNMTSVNVREPDPDDVEHVSTLLSSPAMFKMACQDKFNEFDRDSIGTLDFDEIVALTNTLYQDFGLQQPSEACLRAFFQATDENNDGVLDEREFRKFFEMFLRYAYFEIEKLQKLVDSAKQPVRVGQRVELNVDDVASGPTAALETPTQNRNLVTTPLQSPNLVTAFSPQHSPTAGVMSRCSTEVSTRAGTKEPHEAVGNCSTPLRRRPTDASENAPPQQLLTTFDDFLAAQETVSPLVRHSHWDEKSTPVTESPSKLHRRQKKADRERQRGASGDGSAYVCVAPHNVPYRQQPDYADSVNSAVAPGEKVQILEHWVRTTHGWLPMQDLQGAPLFEKVEPKAVRRSPSGADLKKEVNAAMSPCVKKDVKAWSKSVPKGFQDARHELGNQWLSKVDSLEGNLNKFSRKPPCLDKCTLSPARIGSKGTLSPARSRTPTTPAKAKGTPTRCPDEWEQVFDRLQDRFPDASDKQLMQALYAHDGHAAKAASALKEVW